MKNKTGLFKIILFVLLGIMLLTWIVPASYFYNGELNDLGMYRIGIFDFFQLLFGSFEFTYFIQLGILLVCIGALYGVLSKIDKYNDWIKKISSKFKGKERVFLLAASFLIAAITSAFDYGMSTFIFIPFIISVVIALKYDKFTAFMTTFGAYLVGIIGSTINTHIVGNIVNTVGTITVFSGIWFKIALFALCYGLLAFYLVKAKRLSKKDEVIEDKYVDGDAKSSKVKVTWPIFVIFGVLFVLLVLGCTAWSDKFNIGIFEDLNTAITEWTVEINDEDVALASVILGNISALGDWYYAEMGVMCLFAALILGLVYKQKSEMFTNMFEGAKKMLPTVFLIIFCFTTVYFVGNTMPFPTIAGWILGATSDFNILLSTITTALGSALHVDMLYVANYVVGQVAATTTNLNLAELLIQSIYGVTMFIAPTSAMLVLGLSYLNISYKEWVKKSWLFVLELLIISLLVIFVVALI